MKPQHLSRWLLKLILAISLNLGGLSTAAANNGVFCDAESCGIQIHPHLRITASIDNFYEESADRYEMVGDLVITTPMKSIDLLDASLVVSKAADGAEIAYEVYGTAKAPFADIPLLGNAGAHAQPYASVGLVSRETLQSLLASGQPPLPLAENPEDPEDEDSPIKEPGYLFFHFGSGLSFDVPLNELIGSANENLGFSVPGDQSVTLIFDPEEPYFYMSTESLFEFTETMQQAMEWAREENQQRDNGQENDAAREEGKNILKELPLPSLNSAAWSTEGGIPLRLDTVWGLPEWLDEIKGHLYLDASMPMYKFFELSGEIVTSIGRAGYVQAGNGDLAVNFDLIPGFLNFNMELGRASAGVVINDEEQSGFFSGVKKPDTSFLPSWIPLTPTSETRISGYISGTNPKASSLSAKGEFGFSPDFISSLIGVELNDIVLSQAQMNISADGLSIRGKSNTSIHPSIKLNKSTDVEIYLPFANLAEASIRIRGEIMIIGAGISPTELEISKRGFYINGQMHMPFSVIAMSGKIAAGGPALSGSTKINLPLEKITTALRDASGAVASARSKVNELQVLVDAEIRKVIERRESHAGKLRSATDALSAAQSTVSRLQSAIDYQYRRISSYRSAISSKYRWYKSQPWYKKSWAWGVYAGYKTYKYSQIGAAYTKIGALKAARLTAIVALEAAKYALDLLRAATETLPVEMDPKVASLIVSKESANLVLLAAEEVLKRIPVIDLNAGTRLLVSLDKSGLRGNMAMVVNDKNLVGGRVNFDPVPNACIELPVVGELCTRF